jgi:hypothetical protein
MKKFATTKELTKLLGLANTAVFTSLVDRKDLAGNAGRNKWHVEKFLRDLVAKSQSGRTFDLANKHLATIEKEKKSNGGDKSAKPKPSPRPVAPVIAEPEESTEPEPDDAVIDIPMEDPATADIGLEGAVQRLRHYEQKLAARLSMEMKDNGNVAGAYRDWITAVEQMRKTESELLDVLARRKTLVPVDQVKELFLRMIETTKGLLLVMPAKLSGELEGMEWQDIQKRLDGEIRDILTNLTTSTAF